MYKQTKDAECKNCSTIIQVYVAVSINIHIWMMINNKYKI